MMYQTKNPYYEDTILYQDNKVNIKTVYIIEYIDSKKDFDRIDTHPAAWELYKKIETESLQEAISKYIALFSRQYSDEKEIFHIFDVRMFEDTLLNDEIIRQKCISDIFNFTSIVNNHAGIIQRNNQELNQTIEKLTDELNTVNKFLEIYNATKLFKEFKNKTDNKNTEE